MYISRSWQGGWAREDGGGPRARRCPPGTTGCTSGEGQWAMVSRSCRKWLVQPLECSIHSLLCLHGALQDGLPLEGEPGLVTGSDSLYGCVTSVHGSNKGSDLAPYKSLDVNLLEIRSNLTARWQRGGTCAVCPWG